MDRWTVTLDYRVVAIKLPDTEVTKILRLRRERVRERRKKETRGEKKEAGGRTRHTAPAKTSLKLSSNLRPSTLSEKSDEKAEEKKNKTGTVETHLAMKLDVRLRLRRDLETAPIN